MNRGEDIRRKEGKLEGVKPLNGPNEVPARKCHYSTVTPVLYSAEGHSHC